MAARAFASATGALHAREEAVAFGEEAVPGIDGVRLRQQDRRQDNGDVRVVAGFADIDDLVGEFVPRLFAVGVRHDRHRGDPFLLQDEEEPLGDLAPVRDEHLVELLKPPARGRPGPDEQRIRPSELSEGVRDIRNHGHSPPWR